MLAPLFEFSFIPEMGVNLKKGYDMTNYIIQRIK